MGVSPRTLEFYRLHLGQLLQFLRGQGIRGLEELSPAHLRAYLSWQKGRGIAPPTLHQKFRSMRTFLRWCQREGLLEEDPMAKVDAPRLPRMLVRPYSEEEIGKLLATCDRSLLGLRDRAIILTLLDRGLRAGELCSLTVQDLSGELLKVEGKGQKERLVRLGRTARRAILAYLKLRRDGEPWLFLGRYGEPLNPNALNQMLHRRFREAGIQVPKAVHALRHAFTYLAIKGGADLLSLSYILGHSSLSTTQNYLRGFGYEDAARSHAHFSPADSLARRGRG